MNQFNSNRELKELLIVVESKEFIMEIKFVFHFEIIITVLVSSFRFISIPML